MSGNSDTPSSEADPPPWEGHEEPDHIPAIRALFRDKLGAVRAAIDTIESRWTAGARPDGPDAAELFGFAHQILGSAEPLGGRDLGAAAGALTQLFAGRAEADQALHDEVVAALREATRALKAEIERYERWCQLSPPPAPEA